MNNQFDKFKPRIKSKIKMVDSCWVWQGSKTRCKKAFYGIIWNGERNEVAHRVSYRAFVGEIPKGLTLDHQCRVTLCVNPKHLKPMTLKENILLGNGATAINKRKTHCLRGHPLAGTNLAKYSK